MDKNETAKLKVNIVIPAYNCEATIAKTLQAVLNQEYPKPIDVIVVDDGSSDQTANIIQSFRQVKYVYQDNAGPAAARNTGVENSSGDIVFFTDSDCIPHTDWIAISMPHFGDSRVGAVAGSYDIANPENILARVIHKEILFRHKNLMSKHVKAFGSYNMAIRRKIFDQAGGFDSKYRFASGEDNDLSYKILKSGLKIAFEPRSLVKHYHPTRVSRYLYEQFRHGFWRAKMYHDHPQMASGDDYTFWKDIVEIPLALLCVVNFLLIFLFGFDNILFLKVVLCVSFASLCLIEIFYGFLITKHFFEAFFMFFIMFFRSFSRLAGFSSGIPPFFFKKKPKKT